uniref:Uncharacterized protein n=1 Tax=Globisporangium ultimum (strain ATCC 200006 / CBS 805.95 / DAOM BR144) TaxID=431595 RepID=K3X7T7_GLOUD
MKNLLQLSLVLLAGVLASMAWYVTLMPFWLTQSGERGSAVYYSQGIGIWLNYTEHVGDITFDPGNSLWVPPQESAAHSFTDQCSTEESFCDNAIGELHKQYCQVRRVYCGAAMKFLQGALSVLTGLGLLIAVWSMLLITTRHRTVVDRYLMQLCIFCGLSYLIVAMVWYIFVFRLLIESTFYKDQYNRCAENSSNRSCWGMGVCVYMIIASALLYPMLSVLVANHVTNKFRQFQRVLRHLHESATIVDIPPPTIELKSSNVNDLNKTTLSEVMESSVATVKVDFSAEQADYPALEPLKKIPSVLRAVSVHEVDVSDSEAEEEKRDDTFGTKYRYQVHEETSEKKKATTTTTTVKATSGEQEESL